jgi:hypothetical protein
MCRKRGSRGTGVLDSITVRRRVTGRLEVISVGLWEMK